MSTIKQLNKNLVGHWKFDNNFNDSSGNGNDGSPTAITWKPTRRGLKPSFNGSSSNVLVTHDTNLNPGLGDFTLCAWIYPRSITGASNESKMIVDKKTQDTNNNGYYLRIYYSSSKFYVKLANGSASVAYDSNSVAVLNTWQHIIVSCDRDANLTFYINGKLDVTRSMSATTGYNLNGTDNFVIGTSTNGFVDKYNGFIEDVRLYNVALSADEVLALYNETKANVGIIPAERNITPQITIKPENGLVGAWDMKTRNADGTFMDLSGSSNHGTNVGSSRAMSTLGECRSFDGVNDYIDCGSDSSLRNHTSESIFVWVKPSSFTPTYRTIVDTGYWSSSFGSLIDTNPNQNTILITLKNSSGSITSRSISYIPNEWIQIGFTWDGSNVKFYKNGIIDGLPNSLSGTLSNSGNNLFIGGRTSNYYLLGTINEVEIYNRALSATEISNKYNELATKNLYHIDFKDYPNNEDVTYSDNTPIPYITGRVGSNGTYKVDSDQLQCSEDSSSLTLRSKHEFDGDELVIANKGDVLGKELWEKDASNFTSGTYSWFAYSGSTLSNVNNKLNITVGEGADSRGAYTFFRESADLKTDLIVGRKYRAKVQLSYSGGASAPNIAISYGSGANIKEALTNETKEYTYDFVATHAINAYFNFANCVSGNVIVVDNPSIKELSYEDSGIGNALTGARTQIDSCDATTGWVFNGGSISLNTTTFKEGTGSLNFIKTNTGISECYASKTITSTDLSGKYISVWCYVKNQTALDKLKTGSQHQIFLFSVADSAYYHYTINGAKVGWNKYIIDVDSPTGSTGSPNATQIIKIRFDANTNNASDTFASGDIIMDAWYSGTGKVSVTQGSNLITVNSHDTNSINSIDINFREEV